MKDIYDIVAAFERRPDEPLVLATLVRAEGSSYRRPGARLLVSRDGNWIGSLSGGCIEEEIAAHARSVFESGQPMLVDFDTRRRFGCHGRIEIFIERANPEFLSTLNRELKARRSCVVRTTPEGSFVQPAPANTAVTSPDDHLPGPRGVAFRFEQQVHPPIRLLIVGDGPDSEPLEKFCRLLGWQAINLGNNAQPTFETDEWTGAVVKSHNFGRDFVALAKLLPPNLRYVGLIGPKKRRDELLNELLGIGVPMNAGFHAPAGLDLNAETPEEIALAIVSEIQRVFAGGSGQSLRDRKQPIHRETPVSQQRSSGGWQKSPL